MNKRNALAVLRGQLEALPTSIDIKEWRDRTNAFLELTMDIDKQTFKDFKYYQQNDVPNLRRRLSLCIDVIDKAGVHGAARANWFCRLSDTWITTVIVVGSGLAFWLGTWVPAIITTSTEPAQQKYQPRIEAEHNGGKDSIH